MGKGSKVTVTMDPCTRCTALIHGQQARCGLCGWPAGVPFPEVGAAEEREVGDTQVPPSADESAPAQAGEQLDALSAMVVRQHDLASGAAPNETPDVVEPVMPPPVSLGDSPPAEAQSSDLGTVETTESSASPLPSVLDPLTAPLDLVTADPGLDD